MPPGASPGIAHGDTGKTVLTVSPHPDDETIGAGATLAAFVEQGWSVVNLACTLGHVEDHDRRRAELVEAGRRLGFTTEVMKPLVPLSSSDDLHHSAVLVAAAVTPTMKAHRPSIVLTPHLHDGHHAHEVVAQGVRAALEQTTDGPLWWQYGIWSDLPKPTLLVPYDEDVMGSVAHAIDAYGGENARSHYDVMHPARAVVSRLLGSEKVFGFGTSTASDLPYADLFTELRHGPQGWQVGVPRILDARQPMAIKWLPRDVGWWVRQPSLRQMWTAAG